MFEQTAEGLAVEGFGGDEGLGQGQGRMSLLETVEVNHGAGPDAVELAQQFDAGGFELSGGVAGEKDGLAEQGDVRVGQGGRVTLALLEQTGHGDQVQGVAFVGAEVEFFPFQLDLVGIEQAVEQAGGVWLSQGRGEIGQQGPGPGFVIDAGRLVTEDDQVELTAAEGRVELPVEVVIASLVGGQGGRWVNRATGGGVGPEVVDIFGNVQGQIQDALGRILGHQGGELLAAAFIEFEGFLFLPMAKALPFLLTFRHDAPPL
mgnify:CR=1 FL=1